MARRPYHISEAPQLASLHVPHDRQDGTPDRGRNQADAGHLRLLEEFEPPGQPGRAFTYSTCPVAG
jgi:hypothetical protein